MQLLFYYIYLSVFAHLAIFTFNVYFHLTVIEPTLFFTFYQYMIKFYNYILDFVCTVPSFLSYA